MDIEDSLEFCELNLLSDDGWAEAMQGCDYVFHSAVNTSAWLQNSGPLYETNV